MSILKKIITAIRGGAREMGELVVDANSTRIFEQEIRDAEGHLRKAKQDLTNIMARHMQASRQVETLKLALQRDEGYALAALDSGDEGLARDLADKIAQNEIDLQDQQAAQASFSEHIERMRALVQKTERQVKAYQRQLSMLKTTASVQKASAAISDSFATSSSRILSARDSLARIKRRQQETFDRMAAAEALQAEDESLDARLQAAGIAPQPSSADTVLARLQMGRA